MSWSKDVQVETLRLEHPPDDDQVIPEELKREVAWACVSLVTAWASVVPPGPRTPTPGAKRTPRARARAVRAERSLGRVSMGGFLLLMTHRGTCAAVPCGSGREILPGSTRVRQRAGTTDTAPGADRPNRPPH
ncbi:hypothetical protein GCM10020227_52320 [Streptomyces flavovirens]